MVHSSRGHRLLDLTSLNTYLFSLYLFVLFSYLLLIGVKPVYSYQTISNPSEFRVQHLVPSAENISTMVNTPSKG